MTKSWILAHGLSALFLAGPGSAIAVAQSPEAMTDATEDVVPEPTTLDTADAWQSYTLPQAFALTIPNDWITDATETERSAVFTNYDPGSRPEAGAPQPEDIKTAVVRVEENPDTFVSRELASIIDNGYQVRRYRTVTVNNQTALRLWIGDLPLDYPRQMITFIGYGQYGTAMIVTYYDTPTADAEPMIEQVHNSFELLL